MKKASIFFKLFIIRAILSLLLLVGADIILTSIMSFPSDYFTGTPNHSFSWLLEENHLSGIETFSNVRFNKLGARSPNLEENNSKIKIAAIGGSTTACFALDQELTWTNLLQEKMGNKVWIGNFGRPGNKSQHHVLQTHHLFKKNELKNTKYAIFLVGINDFCAYLGDSSKYLKNSDISDKYIAFEHIPDTDIPWFKRRALFKMAKNLKRKLNFYIGTKSFTETIKKSQEKRFNSTKINELPSLEQGQLKYQERLYSIIQNCRKNGVIPVFFCQPVLWEENLKPEFETLLSFGEYFDSQLQTSIFYSTKALAEGMKAFNSTLIDLCLKQGVYCFELDLPHSTEAFYDDCHFNKSGAEIVANQIYSNLSTVIPELSVD